MPVYDFKILCHRWNPVGIFLILVFAANLFFPLTSIAESTERILRLTPEQNHYFLGPYVDYLEDPNKNLTINDVSSPQLAPRYFKHKSKMLNLGLNSYAYWIRFAVDPSGVKDLDRIWLLYFGWPNTIDYATLYIPESPDTGWSVKEVGRILPTGPDVLPSTPTAFLPIHRFAQPLTYFLRVESEETKQIPLQILTEEAFQASSRWRSLWFGVYYGLMLAMFLYNLILLFSLRELNRLYYLVYLLFISLVFLISNGLLSEYFHLGVHTGRILILVFICLVFFWGNLFAKSFLITRKHAPFFDKLLSVSMVSAIILAAMVPLTNLHLMTLAVSIQSIIIPPIFLLAAFFCWRRGFRPARFFLIAFATLALSTMFEALLTFDILPYITEYSTQIASAAFELSTRKKR